MQLGYARVVEIGGRWKRLWEERGKHPVCVLDRREDTLHPLFPGQKSAKSSCIKSTYKANKLELALCHFNLADLARDKNAENPSMNHHFVSGPTWLIAPHQSIDFPGYLCQIFFFFFFQIRWERHVSTTTATFIRYGWNRMENDQFSVIELCVM